MILNMNRAKCPSPKCGSRRTREKTDGTLTLGSCRKCGCTWAKVVGTKKDMAAQKEFLSGFGITKGDSFAQGVSKLQQAYFGE